MKQFHCKYCARPMDVNFLEYRSNSFCNVCFDERAASKPIAKSRLNTFEFMGDVIPLEQETTSSQTERMYSEEDLREALFCALNIDRTTCCTTRTTDSIVREVIKMYYTSTYGSKGSDATSSQTQHNSPKVENKTSFGEVSDEEIEKEGWKYCYENKISLKNIVPWINACEWYREQLKTKQ